MLQVWHGSTADNKRGGPQIWYYAGTAVAPTGAANNNATSIHTCATGHAAALAVACSSGGSSWGGVSQGPRVPGKPAHVDTHVRTHTHVQQ